jgi:hypothetical protein
MRVALETVNLEGEKYFESKILIWAQPTMQYVFSELITPNEPSICGHSSLADQITEITYHAPHYKRSGSSRPPWSNVPNWQTHPSFFCYIKKKQHRAPKLLKKKEFLATRWASLPTLLSRTKHHNLASSFVQRLPSPAALRSIGLMGMR